MTGLHESAIDYAADAAAAARGITPLETLLVRAYMAGALEAARRTPHDTLRECIDYGRTVGTALEVAR
jgi:hypothetical protein